LRRLEHDTARTGEYLPGEPFPKPPRRRSWRFLFMFLVVGVVLVFFGTQFARQWFDSLLARIDQQKAVHPDQTVVESGVKLEVKPTVTLIYRNEQGQRVRVLADAETYSAFVRTHATSLEQAKSRIQQATGEYLHTALKQALAPLHERVERFADWYFAYDTTYRILWEALTSASNHALSAEAQSLKEAVAYDVEKYLHKQYKEIVLKPELTDLQLQEAYQDALRQAHSRYVDVIAMMQAEFQVFVKQQTTHLDTTGENSRLVVDWESQFNKLSVGEFEKGSPDAVRGVILALGGGIAGKAVGSAVGKGIAAKAVASAVSKGVFAKMASPFVSKALLAAGSGIAGIAGGPVGAVVGIGVGLGIDYFINEGQELMQRDLFVADVREALTATQQEWEREMQVSLDQAVAVWFGDTIQLLPQFEQ
jgi:hypothetical protein